MSHRVAAAAYASCGCSALLAESSTTRGLLRHPLYSFPLSDTICAQASLQQDSVIKTTAKGAALPLILIGENYTLPRSSIHWWPSTTSTPPCAHQVSAGQSHPAFLRITCAHGRRTGEAARMLPSRSAGRGTRMSAPVCMQVHTVPPSLAIEIPTLASSTCVASSSAVTHRREELSRDAALSPAASCEEDTRRVLVVQWSLHVV